MCVCVCVNTRDYRGRHGATQQVILAPGASIAEEHRGLLSSSMGPS